jgi:hypothetical protein
VPTELRRAVCCEQARAYRLTPPHAADADLPSTAGLQVRLAGKACVPAPRTSTSTRDQEHQRGPRPEVAGSSADDQRDSAAVADWISVAAYPGAVRALADLLRAARNAGTMMASGLACWSSCRSGMIHSQRRVQIADCKRKALEVAALRPQAPLFTDGQPRPLPPPQRMVRQCLDPQGLGPRSRGANAGVDSKVLASLRARRA